MENTTRDESQPRLSSTSVADGSTDPVVAPFQPDQLNRLWQHGMHEERLFHDRLNYFSAVQTGLLAVFAWVLARAGW